LPPLEKLQSMRAKGMTFQAIGEKYGASRALVHRQMRAAKRRGKG